MSANRESPAAWVAPWSPELERQYNMREAFPDHVEYFERWRADSERARHELAPALDVPYGPDERENLDVFRAANPVGAVWIFIHGGYWRTMDKSDFSFLARPFAARGLTVVLPNYPLCPDARIDGIVASTRRMLAWVVENIASYGGRPEAVHVAGWSAGGHLAAMLLACGGGRSAPLARSTLAISGIYDLRPIRHVQANQDLRITEEIARANSPVLLRPASKSRLSIVIGALETAGIHEQARALENAWSSDFPGLRTTSIAEAHHYSVVSQLADESSELFDLAVRLTH